MATYSTGNQSTTNANAFMGLGTPIHLPSLASPQPTDTPYLPKPHHSKNIDMPGITDIPPERQGVDFGNVSHFKYIANDNEVVKKMVLVLKLSSLSAGGGGTDPRYVDDVALAAIDHIDFSFAGNVLQTLYGDELHFRMVQELPEEELRRRQKLQAANLTPGERAALAANDQWIYCEIPFWWAMKDEHAWHQYAFQRLTRIAIHFRNPGFILQQDGDTTLPSPTVSGSNYILDHFLRYHTSCVSEAMKKKYVGMIQGQGNTGWLHLINDWERILDHPLPAGSGSDQTFQILLNTFSKYGYNIRYWIRPTANLVANVTNNRRFETLDIKQDSLMISGKNFQVPLDDFYKKFMVHATKFNGNPEQAIYNIPLTDYPSIHHHGMGGLEFANTANPTLTIVTPSLPSACSLDVYLYVHNYVRLVLRENQSAAETVQPI